MASNVWTLHHAKSVHSRAPWQCIKLVDGDYQGKFRKKPIPMMLVYGEYEGYEHKDGKWVKVKRSTHRWEWLPMDKKIRRSIRQWVPKKDGQDPKDGEVEVWPCLSPEEEACRDLALKDQLDPGAPLHAKVISDYKVEKAKEDDEEAKEAADLVKMEMKQAREKKQQENLQKKLKEKEQEVEDLKKQVAAKPSGDTATKDQLKKEVCDHLVMKSKLMEKEKELEEVSTKYKKFPAEYRVLEEAELLKKLASAKQDGETLTLLKAKVLTYFEGLLERKRDSENNYKGSLKTLMPKSMQAFFENSELL